jgi:hypothetical protein
MIPEGLVRSPIKAQTAGPDVFEWEPFAYLREVLDRVSNHPASRIAELLPDVWRPLQR